MELKIKRPTKGVELCLDLGLRAEWEQAEVELSELRKDPYVDQRIAGGPVTEAAKRVTELEQAMLDATVTFTLSALSHREWTRLRTDHAPRPDDEQDKALGFNSETLFDEAIPASIVSVVGPDGEPVEWDAESWQGLADEMTNRQYMDFQLAVLALNQGDAGARLPKSRSASLTMGRFDAS